MMKLDTAELFKNEGYTVPLEGEIDYSGVDYYGDRPFRTAHVAGKAENRGGIVSLRLDVLMEVETSCARCLKPIAFTKKAKVREILVRKSGETDEASESYTVVDGRTLDLFDVVLSAVLLDIDMVFLCREDCRGLCPVCGADLNEGMCDCGKNDQEDRSSTGGVTHGSPQG